jgi:hypothetical protein
MRINQYLKVPSKNLEIYELSLLKLIKRNKRWSSIELRLIFPHQDIGLSLFELIENLKSEKIIKAECRPASLEIDIELTSIGQIYLIKEQLSGS